MPEYHIKINGIPLTDVSQFKNIVSNESRVLEIIKKVGSKLISMKYTGKILRSCKSETNWFKFYYDIAQEIPEEQISKLDFEPKLGIMVWNDGYETGRLLITTEGI
ncbi:MAG: hypothetical protein ABFC34_03545 [Methanobacterium sp.]